MESIENQLSNDNVAVNRSAAETSEKIVNLLTTVGEATLPRSTRKERVNEIWKNDEEFNRLLNERRKHKFGSNEYKLFTRKIKTRIKHLRNEKLKREAEDINENANRRQVEELYRRMKTDTMTFKNLREKEKCDPQKLKKYFVSHFNEFPVTTEPMELKQLKEIEVEGLNASPSDLEELKLTIKNLKNGKSANDIPAAYVKHAMKCDKFAQEMLNSMRQFGQRTKFQKTGSIASKCNKDDPKAYRGLQIGSTLCKILVIIINNSLKTWYELQLLDEQQGFRSGRGTTDGVYIDKRIHEISNKMKIKTVYVLFVDLAAAFDHIVRELTFDTILKRIPSDVNTKLNNITCHNNLSRRNSR